MDEEVGDVLDDFLVEECEVSGPVVVVPIDSDFEDCSWDVIGSIPQDMFWEVAPEKTAVIGSVVLRGCRFVRCTSRGSAWPEVHSTSAGGSRRRAPETPCDRATKECRLCRSSYPMSSWEILHDPKYTGYKVWNRRQRKRGGKINPPEKWVWSEEPAHESLVSREMFDRGNHTAIKRDNVTKAAEPRRLPQAHLRAAVVPPLRDMRLRMHGNVRRGRNGAYCTCELNRRQASLVPEDHPRTVYLREDRAGEKVVEFLSAHVLGPERMDALRDALATTAPEADRAQAEVERLRGELASLHTKMRRLVTNLGAQAA